ncbi:hypothetical protein PV396_24665 [Streptomyces sp. ME02-8801-2C]|uniref:hypothetical protein n=1 Tax=Streptomyces sp. ME02-8801-2C TaxID=3028680 RepID=UPI0029A4B314|nr:hypothetical protein [Streptomyces sp. ME02-8801-2C]MDX3455096.1 hypothetical protein [Streptomyces sp. ME02-8801-2C]
MSATTSDQGVVFALIFATAAAWLIAALLIKHALDKPCTYTPAARRTRTPALPTALADSRPHARPRACDETTPITSVQLERALHRKEQA